MKSVEREAVGGREPSRDGPSKVPLLASEDWWAVWLGAAILGAAFLVVLLSGASSQGSVNPMSRLLAKPGSWSANPFEAWRSSDGSIVPGVIGVFLIGLSTFGLAAACMRWPMRRFAVGYCGVFLLATFAYVLAGQDVIKHYNLEYALWALLIGLLISNTIGTPGYLRTAACTEFYIKTGLVLLGAEVLFPRLLALGVPGICVAWIVTPVVLITTFWFGQRILKIESPTLNMVISADMSVCGVSAAIASAAACHAKREELSLAIGMSLSFTVVMMVVMPAVIPLMGLGEIVGGAWMGGTIDATGAVAAAGAMLGDQALQVAATVKMIQNILIGFVAFGIAVYWTTRVERGAGSASVGIGEIWRRFPKFILGFLAASIAFSLWYGLTDHGPATVDAVIGGGTKTLRSWFFCMAFVSIGLQTNIRELAGQLRGGKPLLLYVVGQSFNLLLTLLMAWLMFEKVFPGAARVLER